MSYSSHPASVNLFFFLLSPFFPLLLSPWHNEASVPIVWSLCLLSVVVFSFLSVGSLLSLAADWGSWEKAKHWFLKRFVKGLLQSVSRSPYLPNGTKHTGTCHCLCSLPTMQHYLLLLPQFLPLSLSLILAFFSFSSLMPSCLLPLFLMSWRLQQPLC